MHLSPKQSERFYRLYYSLLDYANETFCYGPISCKHYKMGPARAVPYKGRGSASDCGWLDEIVVDRRSSDDE